MARDLETLRQRLQDHLDVLSELEAEAPSTALAERYATLRGWIRTTISQLDAPVPDVDVAVEHPPRQTTSPGGLDREVLPPVDISPDSSRNIYGDYGAYETDSRKKGPGRLIAATLLGLAAVALLAWLYIGRQTDAPADTDPVITPVEESAAAEEPVVIEEPESPPDTATGGISIDPGEADLGRIGTANVVRRFTLRNDSGQAVTIAVERSACRCLWYDVPPIVPANGSVTLTVTLDPARLKRNELSETIGIINAGDRRRLAELSISGTR